MKKTRIIIYAIAGVSVLAALVLGYFIWSAISAVSEAGEELDGVQGEASRLSSLKVFPDRASIEATDGNRRQYEAWKDEALEAAAAGDKVIAPVTPTAFKTFIVEDAKRLASLKGGVEGVLVKPDFAFGFNDYVIKGTIPTEADLPRLQREWNDVSTVVGLLGASAINELTSLEITAASPTTETETKKPGKGRKPTGGKTAKSSVEFDVTHMSLGFTASPAALVASLNALAQSQRFIVVESLAFAPEKDDLAEKIGEQQKKSGDGDKPSRRSKKRRRAAEEDAENSGEKTEDASATILTDPQSVLVAVTMKVSVYDFRHAAVVAEKVEANESEEAK